jgi:ABC-type antimicrobial peptide transport system ATPase subunit
VTVIQQPKHPYTYAIGLLGLTPKFGQKMERVTQIDGAMPRLARGETFALVGNRVAASLRGGLTVGLYRPARSCGQGLLIVPMYSCHWVISDVDADAFSTTRLGMALDLSCL